MNYDVVRTLLDNQLALATGLPQSQKENTRCETGGTEWCRSTLLTAEPTPLSVGMGGLNEHQGLYQVDVFYPQDEGTADANATASEIQECFPRGVILSSGDVQVHVRLCWQQTAYQMDGWYVVPVVVRWVAYA